MPQFVTIIIAGGYGVSINPEHVSSIENIRGADPPGSNGSILTMSNGTKYEVSEGLEGILKTLMDPKYRCPI
jgi:hypothetical protein